VKKTKWGIPHPHSPKKKQKIKIESLRQLFLGGIFKGVTPLNTLTFFVDFIKYPSDILKINKKSL